MRGTKKSRAFLHVEITAVTMCWLDAKIVGTGHPVTFLFRKNITPSRAEYLNRAKDEGWTKMIYCQKTQEPDIYMLLTMKSDTLRVAQMHRVKERRLRRELYEEIVKDYNPVRGRKVTTVGGHNFNGPHTTRLGGTLVEILAVTLGHKVKMTPAKKALSTRESNLRLGNEKLSESRKKRETPELSKKRNDAIRAYHKKAGHNKGKKLTLAKIKKRARKLIKTIKRKLK